MKVPESSSRLQPPASRRRSLSSVPVRRKLNTPVLGFGSYAKNELRPSRIGQVTRKIVLVEGSNLDEIRPCFRKRYGSRRDHESKMLS